MELNVLPWQEALRAALILIPNISIAFIIQCEALERKHSLLPLLVVFCGRLFFINLLGGIVFQESISESIVWNSLYLFCITFQSFFLWAMVFYTYKGSILKIMITSMAAEIYTTVLSSIVLGMINYAEHRESLFINAAPFQRTDLLIPLLMYATFFPMYILFREKIQENRKKDLKHKKLWAVFAVFYILLGIFSWWNGYANQMREMSWPFWILFFLSAAGAGILGIRSWIRYMGQIEKDHQRLKRQQEFIRLYRRGIENQILTIEKNQKQIDQQMEEIRRIGRQKFAGERVVKYLNSLKQEYHQIKAGVYCSEWEIDAILYYYAQKAEEREIAWHFSFENYQKKSADPDSLGQILFLLLEEAVAGKQSAEESKRAFSLTAATVKNQVILVLETECGSRFRTGKIRACIKKQQGVFEIEKKGSKVWIKIMIPCAEYYNLETFSE